jgi:peroxiredoxin
MMTRNFGWWGMAIALVLAVARVGAAPAVGEKAPGFALRTLGGETVRLEAELARGPAVLVVLRGFPGYQCPLCTRQVNEFAGKAREFAAKGARVIFVYPGPAPELEKRAGEFLANKDWPANFVFLVDPDYTFTNAYGLRWAAPKETAYPSTFVIGRDGTVRWSKVSKTHGGRSTAAEVVAQLP